MAATGSCANRLDQAACSCCLRPCVGIATELRTSEAMLEARVSHVFGTLGTDRVHAAVIVALEHGNIGLPK